MKLNIFSLALVFLLVCAIAQAVVANDDGINNADSDVEESSLATNASDTGSSGGYDTMDDQCSGRCLPELQRCYIYCNRNMESTTWPCRKYAK
ncbi:hypothetical protein FE257_011077 [Aspergillus nanangensis]|uniref:Uncharacterized protein n=1 Tax=Aspergillus nanangensis TaxID=2582783 RepID=A0AAD4CHZ2_ASPNN|nr:hypothetical protein FE257_011077 [Aspergillus nanangensis]